MVMVIHVTTIQSLNSTGSDFVKKRRCNFQFNFVVVAVTLTSDQGHQNIFSVQVSIEVIIMQSVKDLT